jgi:hypothetical protein
VGESMRVVRYLPLLICLATSWFAFGQKEDWLPVTDQDIQFKEVPGNPGAPAVRLYYAHYVDDNTRSEFVYERIKILNDKGRQYADIQIPTLVEAGIFVTISDLKARTIHPDGSIVEFTGKPFEKTMYKGQGNKIAVQAFTMPEISVGSIVEYKYRYLFQSSWYSPVILFSTDEWVMQNDLFTVKEHLYFKPYEGGTYQSSSRPMFYWDGAQISRVAFNLKESPKNRGNEVELELHNVPAFEPEGFMPPENNYKPSVVFFYARKGMGSTEKEWLDIGKTRYELLEQYLQKDKGVKEAAVQAIGGVTDPAQKLRKLYARAQQVRNLTYERERTMEERKKENIQKNLGVSDVLSHGYGSAQEITLLFVALARAAGFDASVVQVSDRKSRFFAKDWTSLRQLDGMIAAVSLNGNDVYLEPGARFCPYGLLRWNHTATEGLKLDKKGGVFVKAPPGGYELSVTRRFAHTTVTQDGALKGTITIELLGEEALEHRLDAIDRDDAGKKRGLEDEVKEWLPTGAILNMAEAHGWEEPDVPLKASFTVEVPSCASMAGKLLLVPSGLFQSRGGQTFTHAQRKYPVYFPYAFTETDYVSINVPAGFALENVPEKQDERLKYARYQNMTQFNGTEMVTQRMLAFNGIYFDLDKYQELKGFFSKVKTGDEQQAVLHGGSVNAKKGN